jgi:hypothetical protein
MFSSSIYLLVHDKMSFFFVVELNSIEYKKEDPTFCCLQETHLIDRNKHWLGVKDWKKIYQANGP